MLKFLLSTALLLLASAATAQSLWRDVPAGASPAEVAALIPEARPVSRGPVLLEISQHELLDAAFSVAFEFEQNKLKAITLRSQTASADAARVLAQRITSSLRSRYGLEISTKSRQDDVIPGIDRKWSYRKASVHLQVVEGSVVRLRYQAEITRSTSQI
ncbi:MAG: hypothetical protein AB7S86_14445 [Hydrogenophaga sp.]|uniref:hypothetical protein n=1 Tax=Hydrogenophaga sp. TaxID=1904254 RepID=UPI003D12CFA5